jgi:hypothetical protein
MRLAALDAKAISIQVRLEWRTSGCSTSPTSRDVRLESAKWAKADIEQVAVTNRDFVSTCPNEYTAVHLDIGDVGDFDLIHAVRLQRAFGEALALVLAALWIAFDVMQSGKQAAVGLAVHE